MKEDNDIIKEVIAGQNKSFSLLVERHQRALLRLSYRFTREQSMAEDIVQESFIKAYQKLASFEGRSSFKSWLFQITVNTAKNKLRAQHRDLLNIEDVHIGVDPGAESGLLQNDLKNLIQLEVEKLPEKQKLSLKLRIFEDLSFKEIATIMGCPYDTAKANYRHALLKLKERLMNQDHKRDLSIFEKILTYEGVRSMELEQ